MAKILKLFQYNNYYNRIYKDINAVDDWDDICVYTQNDFNYNPADGVDTSCVVNYDGDCNYAVVLDPTTQDIVSRWFVLDSVRTRLGQTKLNLRRDLLADFYDEIIEAPTFIEKATVSYPNPLLYNSEDMTFNQIKTGEAFLRDLSSCPWIVGYISRDTPATTITAQTSNSGVRDVTDISDIPYYTDAQTTAGLECVSKASDFVVLFHYGARSGNQQPDARIDLKVNSDGLVSRRVEYKSLSIPYSLLQSAIDGFGPSSTTLSNECSQYLTQNIANLLVAQNYKGSADYVTFTNTYPEEGVIYHDTTANKYYLVTPIVEAVPNLFAYMKTATLNLIKAFVDSSATFSGTPLQIRNTTRDTVELIVNVTRCHLTIQEVSYNNSYTLQIPASRPHLLNQPYDMFAIPYPTTRALGIRPAGGSTFYADPNAGMAIAQAISATLTTAQLFDLQLLPYAPEDWTAGLSLVVPSADSTYITVADNNVSICYWCTNDTRSFRISDNYDGTFEGYLLPSTAALQKLDAETKMWRFCSPNYASSFDFSPAKNGTFEGVRVDLTYKPFTPYIHIAPDFANLYGADYGDARGLICGGDFSLPRTSDRWAEYQLQNKNYQLAFDRQIQNLEINQKYQQQSDIWGAVAGSLQGGASGASIGMIAGAGNPAAIAGGAIAGTLASAAGGIGDVVINDKLRKEALDYTKDQFGYQLGNIRALPYTLNKVSAFNINNKIFPFIEYYDCTDTEKQALLNKITYNGMTIMAIGTISEYILPTQSYIKGKIIRLPDTINSHEAAQIYQEFDQGFYIGGNNT